MSEGKCDEHHYANITKVKIDEILNELKNSGSTISGENPWNIDTHNFEVKLRGTWDEANENLSVIVTDKKIIVPCKMIWDKIDLLINNISGQDREEIS
ncbi:hypothetical protein ACFLQ9_00140 [Bacteroidota bacterium]